MAKIGREREDPKVHFQIGSFKSRKTGPMRNEIRAFKSKPVLFPETLRKKNCHFSEIYINIKNLF
jgi:hypothetical protein